MDTLGQAGASAGTEFHTQLVLFWGKISMHPFFSALDLYIFVGDIVCVPEQGKQVDYQGNRASCLSREQGKLFIKGTGQVVYQGNMAS